MRRLTRRRREAIVLAYVLTTRGRLPTHLGELLAAMSSRMGGPVTEDEVRRVANGAQATAHGSGSMWIATPSSYRTCTDYSLPVSRRTAKNSGHYHS